MAAPSSAVAAPPTANGDEHHHSVRLACQACQRKKIRCDRHFPCGQCTRSSLQCVPSTRKPRARHAGKRALDSELRNRITKLESLVESLSGEVGLPGAATPGVGTTPGGDDISPTDPAEPAEPADPADPANASSPIVGMYMGSPFWSSLTTEVQALRVALEDHSDEDDADALSPSSSSGKPNSQSDHDYDLIMCPPGTIFVMPGALNVPTPEMQAVLNTASIDHVGPIFHCFHTPTLRAFLERGAPYLGQDASAPPQKALKAALWYCAVTTMTDHDCRTQLGRSKADLLQRYKRMTDVLLSQADLINTNDMATLQAFITYLACSRITDVSRRMWTLTALAVRIARAMGLDRELPGRTPFENEIRRRLWHQLRVLDAYSAIDRGTAVLILPGTYDTPRPNNVNDSEFDESSTSIPNHETGMTDMSYPLLTYEATEITQRLMVPESTPQGDTWQHRLELAQAFERTAQEKYAKYCDMSIPFHRLVAAACKQMSSVIILRAIRPMQKHLSSIPPRVDNPYVLQTALDVLTNNDQMFEDPAVHRWQWLIWVQWYPLAVALAGLCSIRGTELAERAWIYVERAYVRYEKSVADTKNGMLWRPVEKLYKRARAFRDEGRRESLDGQPGQAPSYSVSGTSGGLTTGTSIFSETPQSRLNHHNMPMGSMPLDTTLFNTPLDFSDATTSPCELAGLTPALQTGDTSWMDWENLMDDLSGMPMERTVTGFPLGDLQGMPHVPSGGTVAPQHVQLDHDWFGLPTSNSM